MKLIQIKAPHFVAGLVIDRLGFVTQAAPIIKYMERWSIERVVEYCKKKSWDYRFTG